MHVGFVGAGKLGLPVALACESLGHEVLVCDKNPAIADYLSHHELPYDEKDAEWLLASTHIRQVGLEELVDWAEVIFVAVQTPHGPRFEGTSPLTEERADFDYGPLTEAVQEIVAVARDSDRAFHSLVVVSTVLPGTLQREILPLLPENIGLAYSPQFIAMGTAVPDFLEPEFCLIGAGERPADRMACKQLSKFYLDIDAPTMEVSYESAELAKMAYNVFIGMKIAFANWMGELADATGANADAVTGVLAEANARLLSPRYLRAGMGDGGGCHPRDGIALSWASRNHCLSYDLPGAVMEAREGQARRLAETIKHWAHDLQLPIRLVGYAYKADSAIATGSAAVLLMHFLPPSEAWDPYVDGGEFPWKDRAVYAVTCAHACLADIRWPAGSFVVDPCGVVKPQEGIPLLRPGRATPPHTG